MLCGRFRRHDSCQDINPGLISVPGEAFFSGYRLRYHRLSDLELNHPLTIQIRRYRRACEALLCWYQHKM